MLKINASNNWNIIFTTARVFFASLKYNYLSTSTRHFSQWNMVIAAAVS